MSAGLLTILIFISAGVGAGISYALSYEYVEKKFKNKLYKEKDFGDLTDEEEDFPGLLSCPCCRESKISLIRNIKFPNIKTIDGNISFYKSDTELEYHIECPKCGMQTKNFYKISEAIMYWNGKSNSTEMVPRDIDVEYPRKEGNN